MKMVRIWTTETIRRAATDNGGVPANAVSVFDGDGHLVTWDRTGEVRTNLLIAGLYVTEIQTS
jgi:hypothetical protein